MKKGYLCLGIGPMLLQYLQINHNRNRNWFGSLYVFYNYIHSTGAQGRIQVQTLKYKHRRPNMPLHKKSHFTISVFCNKDFQIYFGLEKLVQNIYSFIK
jgi:hypothetical protein